MERAGSNAMNSGARRIVQLSQLGWILLAGLAVGGGIAAWVLTDGPFRDPLDVVGPSLMLGYSEANEQWACYLFLVALVVTTWGTSQLRGRGKFAAIGVLGRLFCLLIVVVTCL